MLRVLPSLGLLLACLMGGAASQQSSPQTPQPAATLKAAFLLRFADFVEWPLPHQGPMQVCLSRTAELSDAVATLAPQTRVKGRALVVRVLEPDTPLDNCEIAFLLPADHWRLDGWAARPVLTVGDTPGFCAKGGIINFHTARGRLRFEISLDNARRAGLSIHPQLLQLATTVFGGRQ